MSLIIRSVSQKHLELTKKDIINKLKNRSSSSQKAISSLLQLNNAKYKNIWITNSVAVSLPESLIRIIAAQKDVSIVRLDKKIVLDALVNGAPPAQSGWNISAIGANTVWTQGVNGSNVVIGTMDTGVDFNHPDLSISWRGGNNSWLDPYGAHASPYDSNGHGTQVTSLIVGGSASGQTIGVAPGSQWIAAKIFDDTDTASISAIHLAFQWMLDPDGDPLTDDSVDILNNSWNFGATVGQCDYEFQDDISILRAADIAVVFSAGNSGPSPETSVSPANNVDTVPVGAIDQSLNVAFSSSRGPSACNPLDFYPKLSAPGIDVKTADLTFGGIIPDSYAFSSGTSFAAPHVAGSLALMQSKFPSSSLTERENALNTTAAILGDVNDYGHGIIDVYAAIQYLGTPQLLSPSGNIANNSLPLYEWSAVPDATAYRIIVININTNNTVIDQNYTPLEVACEVDASCSFASLSSLPDGQYRWRVRAENPVDWGPWTVSNVFSVGSAPIATTLISPSANTVTPTPTFTWDAVTGANDYRLLVRDNATNATLIDTLYSAAEAGCDTGTVCSPVYPPLNWLMVAIKAGSEPKMHLGGDLSVT